MARAPSNNKTLKEYGRGIIGGLIFSLPLVYTMEVWWTGFIAQPIYLITSIFVTYMLLLGYNRYAGMKKDSDLKDICWDSVEEFGLAFIVSFLFLLLISRIDMGMSFDEIVGKVVVESMVVAIGISVGTAQLGEGGEDSGMTNEKSKENGLLKLIVLSFCGAVLFASSVAPTEEILMIAVESTSSDLLFMVIATLLLSSVILFYSDFKGSSKEKISFRKMLFQIMLVYMVALTVSLGLLWFFGRMEDTGFSVSLGQTIVLAIPGAIGASAGRFLIKG